MIESTLPKNYGSSRTRFRILMALAIASVPVQAFASDQIIRDSCKNDLKLSDSGCDCVVNEANENLNANQLEFFIAAISKDNGKMMEMQSKISGDEMMELTNFMTTTPTTCKNQ